jgi:hypothetical protein
MAGVRLGEANGIAAARFCAADLGKLAATIAPSCGARLHFILSE